MARRQRKILIVGMLVITFLVLFPPRYRPDRFAGTVMPRPTGQFSWRVEGGRNFIDHAALLELCGLALLLTGAGILLARPAKKGPGED